MPLPVVYRKQGENIIASYSFYDTSTGTGYKTFYGLYLYDEAVACYVLLPEEIETQLVQTGGADNTAYEVNYDLTVKSPMKLQGAAFISQAIRVAVAGGAVNSVMTMKLFRVVSGAETQIGATVTSTQSVVGSANYVHTGRIDIDTATTIAAGDLLRVEIATQALGAGNTLTICHDPSNRSGTSTYPANQLTVNLPFKLDY